MKNLFTAIFLLAVSCSFLNASDWYWKHPVPTGNELNVIESISAVGDGCFITGGDNGYLAVTYDAGASCSAINIPTTDDIVGIIPGSEDGGYACAVTEEGNIYSTNGNLLTSLRSVTGLNDLEVEAVTYSNTTAYIACNNQCLVIRSSAGNCETKQLPSGAEPSAICVSNNSIYVGTEGGDIYKSVDNGNWTKTLDGDNKINDIYFASDLAGGGITNVGYAAANSSSSAPGVYYKTTDNGDSWTAGSTNKYYNNIRCFFLNSDIGVLVSQYGYLMITFNGGTSWTEARSNVSSELTDIDADSQLNILGVSETGEVIKWLVTELMAGNIAGTLISSAKTGFLLRDIDVYGQIVLSVGENGAMIRSTDNGSTWESISNGISADISGCGFFGNDTAYCVTEAGTVFRSFDAGVNWKSQTFDNERAFYAMKISNGNGLIAGEKTTIYYTANSGKKWSKGTVLNTTAFDIRGISFDYSGTNATAAWLCGEGGKIAMTTDGGELWELSANANVNHDLYGISVYAKTGYAVGDYGTVVKTVDGGLTWSTLTFPTNSNLRDVYTSDGTNVIVVGENGTLYGSEDGGNTWKQIIVHTDRTLYRVKRSVENNNLSMWVSGGVGLVLYSVNPMAGVKENNTIKDFGKYVKVFPNPTGNVVRLNADNVAGEIKIIDLNGNTVKKVTTTGDTDINVSDLSAGFYLIKFSTSDGTECFGNFIKK